MVIAHDGLQHVVVGGWTVKHEGHSKGIAMIPKAEPWPTGVTDRPGLNIPGEEG